jgi:hypothetical protein
MRGRIALGLVLAWSLHGAAWTQEQGHGQIILNFSFMDSSRWFDASRKLQSFGDHGSFRQVELNPYVEYGLNSKTTLVLNTLVPWMRYANDYGSAGSGGLGDTELGVRRRLTGESRTVVSLQFTVKFPMYSAARTPAPGNHQVDLEPGVTVGRGGTLAARHVFAGGGAAYRRRNGAPADQFRSDVTVGMDFNRRFTGLVQYFGITGLRNGAPVRTGGNPNVQSDFDLYKAQFSVVTRIQSHIRFQMGWVASFAGRNTGAGGALLAALWRDF